jgi:phosphatidate cytidylyltransferase
LSKASDILVNLPTWSGKPVSVRFSLDWVTRPVFGVVLAAVTLAAVVAGTDAFAVVIAVSGVAALREWHRIVESGSFAREFWLSGATLLLAVGLLAWRPGTATPWLVLLGGGVAVFLSAVMRRANPFWQVAGTVYIGIPALLLMALRASAHHAVWVLIGLFLVVWATDTGALIMGNLVGGPKLTPTLSPNKTWSGALGGVLAASVAAGLLVAALHGKFGAAVIVAALLSVVAHLGDLFESWVKRQFRFKDSGGLIPGHGGVLDRLDSTLAASVAMAAAVFVGGLDATFGAHL